MILQIVGKRLQIRGITLRHTRFLENTRTCYVAAVTNCRVT